MNAANDQDPMFKAMVKAVRRGLDRADWSLVDANNKFVCANWPQLLAAVEREREQERLTQQTRARRTVVTVDIDDRDDDPDDQDDRDDQDDPADDDDDKEADDECRDEEEDDDDDDDTKV